MSVMSESDLHMDPQEPHWSPELSISEHRGGTGGLDQFKGASAKASFQSAMSNWHFVGRFAGRWGDTDPAEAPAILPWQKVATGKPFAKQMPQINPWPLYLLIDGLV